MPCLMAHPCGSIILHSMNDYIIRFCSYICSVKIHQKILLIIALICFLSSDLAPFYPTYASVKHTQRQLTEAYVFDVPEPFIAALPEQSRVSFASPKLPSTYLSQYESIFALFTQPEQLAICLFPSLQFQTEGASIALNDLHYNILFPFHFFG